MLTKTSSDKSESKENPSYFNIQTLVKAWTMSITKQIKYKYCQANIQTPQILLYTFHSPLLLHVHGI